MGSFIVNFHVRGRDRSAVEKRLIELRIPKAWVTEPKRDWLSIYEEQASDQDERRILEVGASLSAALKKPTLAFLVHDSDVFAYWLFENGQLTDQYNSCPDYFEEEADEQAERGGDPRRLRAVCTTAAEVDAIEEVLHTEAVFAEEQLAQLASLLGIDEERALADFRMIGEEIEPQRLQAAAAGLWSDGGDFPRGAASSPFDLADELEMEVEGEPKGLLSRLPEAILQMMGLGGGQTPADPRVQRLVDAAARGDVAALEQTVEMGANVNGLAPLNVDSWASQETATSAQQMKAFQMMGINAAVSPLMAAVMCRQHAALQRLIDLGADLHAVYPLFGTAVHVAATQGDLTALRILLDHGGDANKTNQQGQTPLRAVEHVMETFKQMFRQGMWPSEVAETIGPDGGREPALFEGLRACAALLKERGGQ